MSDHFIPGALRPAGFVRLSLFFVFMFVFALLACGQSDLHSDTNPAKTHDARHATTGSNMTESSQKSEGATPGEKPATTRHDRLMEQLEALGYADGTREAPRARGVTVHDSVEAWRGYNLYTSGHGPQAILMDMEGHVLHRWHHGLWSVWPDLPRPKKRPQIFWRRAYLFENGDLLAIFRKVYVNLDVRAKRSLQRFPSELGQG